MAQQQAPDDIFALYCRFDLDVSQYRVFDRGTDELLDDAADATLATQAGPASLPEHSPVERVQPHPVSAHPQTPSGAEEKSKERAGLRNLITSLHQLHERSISPAFGNPCRQITVTGSSGGVGVTTVMATLARQFSKQGSRCGLYDEAVESILPFFFGFQRIAAHTSRFAGLSAVLEPSVRLLGPDCAHSNIAFPSGEFTLRDKIFRSFENELDFFISEGEVRPQDAAQGTTLFVALPDLQSVANIRALINKTGWRCKNEDTICVLNRFDSSVALHQELLPWYQEQFSQVVTVRHSYLIPEALAEGTSLIEFAPEAEVTSDFARLAGFVRQAIAQTALSPKRGEGTKNQMEGLALCS